MKTNLNNIRQKCTWQNLQQNHMQQMWDLFVERRYFKFQNEIQFSSNSIMEQLNIIGLLLAWQVFANVTATT